MDLLKYDRHLSRAWRNLSTENFEIKLFDSPKRCNSSDDHIFQDSVKDSFLDDCKDFWN